PSTAHAPPLRSSPPQLDALPIAAFERSAQLERELEKACRARDQFANQLKSEQQSAAKAATEEKNRLDGLTAELELSSAEAAQLRSSAQQLEAAGTAAVERSAQLE